ncbi:MAG: DUF2267 domain-containing protein [Streptosporangiales bacterium]|nr:DUF2267 domain-containing protein [Streptosporangiales bacterium]
MRHDEFIGQVQQQARLSSRGDAERATRATLETLAERIPGGLAENLAAQLPIEVGEHLRRVTHAPDEPELGERFGRNEFVTRIAERAGGGVDFPEAAHWARAVFALVDEATSGSLTEKVAQSLPEDIRTLVTA